jgi:hypothetical protein
MGETGADCIIPGMGGVREWYSSLGDIIPSALRLRLREWLPGYRPPDSDILSAAIASWSRWFDWLPSENWALPKGGPPRGWGGDIEDIPRAGSSPSGRPKPEGPEKGRCALSRPCWPYCGRLTPRPRAAAAACCCWCKACKDRALFTRIFNNNEAFGSKVRLSLKSLVTLENCR